ncbi:hypothetical protein N7517_006522 [Penicillium concentricum]|uniref:Uncharacterized protein n=1 Tax=Penicillium concentricum TaxID=293559 RepID=A0A9W9VCL5_9EURO|nr:uncharacterized protein N7517_006522 [Penicillium concentricum]KAJ5374516.1 hypothetical protein N7517_006522 [Penicillium concentricum]
MTSPEPSLRINESSSFIIGGEKKGSAPRNPILPTEDEKGREENMILERMESEKSWHKRP